MCVNHLCCVCQPGMVCVCGNQKCCLCVNQVCFCQPGTLCVSTRYIVCVNQAHCDCPIPVSEEFKKKSGTLSTPLIYFSDHSYIYRTIGARWVCGQYHTGLFLVPKFCWIDLSRDKSTFVLNSNVK